jgi:hypothetical protein
MSTFTSWRAIMRALVPGAWCLVPGAWCLVPGAWCPGGRPGGRRPGAWWPRAWCPGAWSLVRDPCDLVRDPCDLVRDPCDLALVAGGRRPGALAHGPRALQRK